MASHYNLGNYYLNHGEVKQALPAYDTALKLEPAGRHGPGRRRHGVRPDR